MQISHRNKQGLCWTQTGARETLNRWPFSNHCCQLSLSFGSIINSTVEGVGVSKGHLTHAPPKICSMLLRCRLCYHTIIRYYLRTKQV